MNFHLLFRNNPATGEDERYFRLKESFRDATGMVRNRTVLTVGFDMNDIPIEDVRHVASGLTELCKNGGDRATIFGDRLQDYTPAVRGYIEKYWRQIVEKGKLDVIERERNAEEKKAERLVDIDTVEHKEAREAGAEWVCLQAIRELGLDTFLEREEWPETRLHTALSVLITRSIYTCSELKSIRVMEENSAVCELVSGKKDWRPAFRAVYEVAPALYWLKDKLEDYLCRKTDSLFNTTNRIVLFDLTNFYFEGRKEGSRKAAFGRSKEKRGDCKLLVLALCVNEEGFIRYTSILPGDTSDPSSLPSMVDALRAKARIPDLPENRTLVCIDAGIATEENLALIKQKGYNYLCVSRSRLSRYEYEEGSPAVTVLDSKKQPIHLPR